MKNAQNDTLNGVENSVDVATQENLAKLVTIGEEMLTKPVSRVDLRSGLTQPVPDAGTNEEALKRYSHTEYEKKVGLEKQSIKYEIHSL